MTNGSGQLLEADQEARTCATMAGAGRSSNLRSVISTDDEREIRLPGGSGSTFVVSASNVLRANNFKPT